MFSQQYTFHSFIHHILFLTTMDSFKPDIEK